MSIDRCSINFCNSGKIKCMANIWYYTCQLSAFQFVSTFFFHQFRCCGVDSYRDWSDVSELSLYQTARYPGFASFVKLGRNVTSSNRGAGERKVFRVPASCCEYVAPSDNSNHPNVVSWSNCYASVESAEEVLLHTTLNFYRRTLFDITQLIIYRCPEGAESISVVVTPSFKKV